MNLEITTLWYSSSLHSYLFCCRAQWLEANFLSAPWNCSCVVSWNGKATAKVSAGWRSTSSVAPVSPCQYIDQLKISVLSSLSLPPVALTRPRVQFKTCKALLLTFPLNFPFEATVMHQCNHFLFIFYWLRTTDTSMIQWVCEWQIKALWLCEELR